MGKLVEQSDLGKLAEYFHNQQLSIAKLCEANNVSASIKAISEEAARFKADVNRVSVVHEEMRRNSERIFSSVRSTYDWDELRKFSEGISSAVESVRSAEEYRKSIERFSSTVHSSMVQLNQYINQGISNSERIDSVFRSAHALDTWRRNTIAHGLIQDLDLVARQREIDEGGPDCDSDAQRIEAQLIESTKEPTDGRSSIVTPRDDVCDAKDNAPIDNGPIVRSTPGWAERLGLLVLPKADRDALLGDLEEEYRSILARHGSRYARLWYNKQVVFSVFAYARSGLFGFLSGASAINSFLRRLRRH